LVLEQRKDRFNWQESSGNSRKMLKLAVWCSESWDNSNSQQLVA
jgi:hypothetical protein